MESNLVLAFINETNCDDETAYTYLQSHCWNINAALESWRYLHVISNENSDVNQDNERTEGIWHESLSNTLINISKCKICYS